MAHGAFKFAAARHVDVQNIAQAREFDAQAVVGFDQFVELFRLGPEADAGLDVIALFFHFEGHGLAVGKAELHDLFARDLREGRVFGRDEQRFARHPVDQESHAVAFGGSQEGLCGTRAFGIGAVDVEFAKGEF